MPILELRSISTTLPFSLMTLSRLELAI